MFRREVHLSFVHTKEGSVDTVEKINPAYNVAKIPTCFLCSCFIPRWTWLQKIHIIQLKGNSAGSTRTSAKTAGIIHRFPDVSKCQAENQSKERNVYAKSPLKHEKWESPEMGRRAQ